MAIDLKGMKDVIQKLDKFQLNMHRNMGIGAANFAGVLEDYAVANRNWVDRTGAARNSLTGSSEQTSEEITVALAIGVEYGVHLELSHGGKNRIIGPTVDANRQRFMNIAKVAMKGAQ
jgi:hypothetical protein